jgi:hypothetical protein
MRYGPGTLEYPQPLLFRAGLGWQYDQKQSTHEVLSNSNPRYMPNRLVEGVKVVMDVQPTPEDNKKRVQRDAPLLEEDLKKDPNNSRVLFYFAQTKDLGGKLEEAVELYQRRITHTNTTHPGQNDEERKLSYFRIADIYNRRNDYQQLLHWGLSHWDVDPDRAEGLCVAMEGSVRHGRFQLANRLALLVIQNPKPNPLSLFVDKTCELRAHKVVVLLHQHIKKPDIRQTRKSLEFVLEHLDKKNAQYPAFAKFQETLNQAAPK